MTPTSNELATDETYADLLTPPKLPSVHTRAALTWLAIFPMVSAGMLVLAWLAPPWHPVLRSLVLTLIVVPLTVYITVPALLKAHHKTVNRTWRKPRPVITEVDSALPTEGA
ncbi:MULTISPECIES: hypothetical protein [unclassified Glutamicibacter]|uniref:hypothetical protein n=1 Tax=unclassified Glutamicibacter TaxID=2627139 RepID=UPI0021CA48B3|nr:hypothetical protein [Glutamicibacter sp. M10]UXN32757.1 hypothetical protein N6V40_04715 [Glutamicibacter sp. M10]